MGQKGFFDVERRLEAISAKGDPLETIKKIVPWENFRADIEAVTETKPEQRKSNAGRKPYDAILKFKIVVLQSLHNLSDGRPPFLHHRDATLACGRRCRSVLMSLNPEGQARAAADDGISSRFSAARRSHRTGGDFCRCHDG